MLWALRLSPVLHLTPTAVLDVVTARDLALYQAWVEHDGPWWGEHQAAILRQLCSLQAAAVGVSLTPDDFAPDWVIGKPASGELPAAERLTSADGVRLLAARFGLPCEEVRTP